MLGRRPDGFHDLETLITRISLADRLKIDLSSGRGIEFSCDEPEIPQDRSNLVVQAAEAFMELLPKARGVRIRLEKKIPHGAGLGGGSSNAAATLLALNQLCGHVLDSSQLRNLAAKLGSDIPFFLGNGPAKCTGRGDVLEPCAFSQELPLLLIKPPFSVSTPWAYSRWQDARELHGIPYAAQIIGSVTLVNDLERPVFEKFLILGILKRWLLKRPECLGALMSGSGSTLFAILREPSLASELAVEVRAEFGDSFWTHAGRAVGD